MPAKRIAGAIDERDPGRMLTCKELKQTSDVNRKVLRNMPRSFAEQ